MARKLTDEFLKWTLDVDGKPAMSALNSMEQSTMKLKNTNKALFAEMAKLEAQGKKNSEEYAALNRQFVTNNATINQANSRMTELRGQIGLTSLTSQQLRQRMTELRKAMDQSVPNSDAWKQHQRELAEVSGRYNQVRASAVGTRAVFGQIGESLTSMPGPIGSATSGFMTLGKELWALVANPIGLTIAAIVASLTLLYKAFTSTDSGAVAMEGTLKALGNVMDVLIDRAMSYYKMLWSLVTFDFKGVKQNGAAVFGGLGKAIKDATAAGWDYALQMDDISDREAAASNRMTKLRVDIENLKNVSKDLSKTNKERMAAAQEAMDMEIELNGIEKGFLSEKNDAETKNLASKIQNSKMSMAQKEEQLKQWLAVDDRELASLAEKDKAFAEFVNKNEGEFQALQKTKADELMKEAELAQETRRLQSSLSGFKKEMIDGNTKANEEAHKKVIDLAEVENKQKIDLINKNHIEGLTSEAQYNAELFEQESSFLRKKLTIYKAGSKEYEDTAAALSTKQVDASREVQEMMLKAEKAFEDAKISNMQEGIDKEKAIETQRYIQETDSLKEQLRYHEGLTNDELLLNEKINATILEKETEHQKKMIALNSAADMDKLNSKNEALGKINNAAGSYDQSTPFLSLDLMQSYFDERKALIEEQFKNEQILAGDNQEKLKEAESKHIEELIQLKSSEVDATYAMSLRKIDIAQSAVDILSGIVDQESALGKALFVLQQGLAIANIWVSTAQANAKAMAMLVLPPLWGPVVATNTIFAGIQTALVLGQTVAKLSGGSKKDKGKQSGGYADGYLSDATPVGVYHANEFIASAPIVRNPTVRPILDIIDIAQRTGNAKNLNLAKIISGSMQSRGNETANTSQTSNLNTEMTKEILSTLNQLNSQLKNGIKATATINKYGHNGLMEGLEQIDKFKASVLMK